jgi:hypothetical protein
MEEISDMIRYGLLFSGGEIKVGAVRKEFLGNVEHQMTQSGGEEGCIQGLLAFWHHSHLPSRWLWMIGIVPSFSPLAPPGCFPAFYRIR